MSIYPETKFEKFVKSRPVTTALLIVFCIFLMCLCGCSFSVGSNIHTPSKKDINNAMSKSDWRYIVKTKIN